MNSSRRICLRDRARIVFALVLVALLCLLFVGALGQTKKGKTKVAQRSVRLSAELRARPGSTQDVGRARTGEPDVEDEDGEAEVIRDRIRWFKDRHPQLEPEERLKLVQEEYQRREAEKVRIAEGIETPAVNWISLGPGNGAGRVSSLAVHPTATGTVYVGADGGGVWKTTDGGNTWINLTDSINNLNVGAIAVAPSSPNIVYVGTGSEHDDGIGLLKSTDGGSTWQFPVSVAATRFWRISVHPNNPLELVAATDRGGLRSIDGGNSWSTVLTVSQSFNWVQDLKRDPTNPSILYAAGTLNAYQNGVFFKSTNGGLSWTQKTAGLPSNSDVMAIAITPSNPQVLYVSTSIGSGLSHIYKSTDAGETWVDLQSVYADPGTYISRFLGSQAGHDNTIVVSPTNPNIVTAGGVRYIRSMDGGQTWAQPFCDVNFNCFYVHADWTDQQYQGADLWIANDGGVFSNPGGGNNAVEHNTGLMIREYYAMSNHAVLLNSLLAGSQDNGTDFRQSSGDTAWFSMPYCDGFDSAINPQKPNIAYATCQGGQIYRTKEFGTNQNILSFPPATLVTPPYSQGETRPFATKLVMDANNPSTLYTVTNSRVWKTTNDGDSWTPLPTTTTDGSTMEELFYLAVARSNSNVLMAWSGGGAFRSTDGGMTWIKRSPPFSIRSLEIDPQDSNTLYAGSFTGGCAGCSGVYMSTNGGATWVQRGNGLPSAFTGVLSLRVNPLNSNTLYCGTYNAVYRSSDRGQNWTQFGSGLPSIYIEDLRITGDGSLLRVATYGRSVWEIQLTTSSVASIGGRVTNGVGGGGIADVTMSLNLGGSVIAVVQTNGSGNYSFSNLMTGLNYTVTPSRANFVFAPESQFFNGLSTNQTANFTATPVGPPVVRLANPGLYNPTTSTFFLRNSNSAGAANLTFNYGPAGSGWLPVVGDWDGNGTATAGLYDPTTSTFFLKNTNAGGSADLTFPYGPAGAGWLPIVGDWNGDGTDTVGLYQPSTATFFLKNSNSAGSANLVFSYGPAGLGWLPLAGDWNGDGVDTVGLYQPSSSAFFLKNTNSAGSTDLAFIYGPAGAGWTPVVGDWDQNGTATAGLYNPATSTFFLKNTNSAGPANLTFGYGPASAGWKPLAGDWDGQ